MDAEYSRLDHILFGFYACRWKKRGNLEENTSKMDKYFVFGLVVAFVMCTSWLYSWSVLNNDANDVNSFLFDELKFWFQWYILLLAISVIAVAYLLSLLLLSAVFALRSKPLSLALCHKVFVLCCLFFAMCGYIVIGQVWPDVNAQWGSISASFGMTGIFLQLFSFIFWVFFSTFVTLQVYKVRSTVTKIIVFILYLSVLFFLFSIVFWLYSPCIQSNAGNHIKPHLIGHRGFPVVAPENTMFSFHQALSCGIYGFESDVRFSSDGIPFLMHDSTLLRTTNIDEVYPKRKDQRAESFSWSELQTLNAGQWFLNTDPFLSENDLSANDKHNISMQKIPSLLEWASYAAKNNVSIIFDLSRPPQGHKNHYDWVNVTVHTLLRSGIPQYNVLWLCSSSQNISIVKALAPDFRFVTPDVVYNASRYGIDAFNLLYSMTTRDVIALNYSVISYTVDTSWVFSRAWCQGVWAVTTTKCSLLQSMNKPSWTLSHSQYFGIWISIELLILVAGCCLVYFCYYKLKRHFGLRISNSDIYLS